jgi:hypothetical protein
MFPFQPEIWEMSGFLFDFLVKIQLFFLFEGISAKFFMSQK